LAALSRGCHLYSARRHHVGHWPTFYFVVVKATALKKQQISKFRLQILSTETRFYVYDRLNVIASDDDGGGGDDNDDDNDD